MLSNQDYINIGSTPCDEDCAQVGSQDYYSRARAECERFRNLLRKKFGPEPAGARLAIKTFPHEFGSYLEVVCYYEEGEYNEETGETEQTESEKYALRCSDEMPKRWED